MFNFFHYILECLKYRRLLNDTMYQDNPITFKELYIWISNYWSEQVAYDLRKAWDKHNFHDVETL